MDSRREGAEENERDWNQRTSGRRGKTETERQDENTEGPQENTYEPGRILGAYGNRSEYEQIESDFEGSG